MIGVHGHFFREIQAFDLFNLSIGGAMVNDKPTCLSGMPGDGAEVLAGDGNIHI